MVTWAGHRVGLQLEQLALLIAEKRSNLEALKLSLSVLENDIHKREQKVEHLKEKEVKMHKKESLLKHVKYLKGEIDGLISNYIVEGKMAEVLRQTTNAYLDPFTGSRYTINKISSTMRRLKGMESHGLEIILIDNKDNITKTKVVVMKLR